MSQMLDKQVGRAAEQLADCLHTQGLRRDRGASGQKDEQWTVDNDVDQEHQHTTTKRGGTFDQGAAPIICHLGWDAFDSVRRCQGS